MSQNQTSWPGDKIPNIPIHIRTPSGRKQPQTFFVPPSTSPMQPPTNQPGDQAVNHYRAISTSTSVGPQLTTTSSAYMPAPPVSNPQYSAAVPMPSGPTSMEPQLYQNYGWSNGMGFSDASTSVNPTFTYSHQHNTQVMPNTSSSQWSPQENNASSHAYGPQNHAPTTFMSSEPIAQNQIAPTSQYAMLSNIGTPSQFIDNVGRTATPMAQNGLSSRSASQTPRARAHRSSRESSRANRLTRPSRSNRVEKNRGTRFGDKAPLKWKPGMKERKITDEMTEEEKEEATEWNYRFSEAKKAHTREQNRVSAQKSRQKKVVLLERTQSQVEQLDGERARLQSHVSALEATVQQLSNENLHLSSQNEILRQRVALLEQQIQIQPRNPQVALPPVVTQSQGQNQTPAVAPGVSQAQNFMQAPTPATRQNPTPIQNAAQTQAGFDFGLGAAQTAQAPTTNGPVDPGLQQPENATREAQDDYILDWMEASLGEFAQNSDPNGQAWSPPNGGAQ